MAKALHAVAQLEWQEGLETWGPHRIEHRTEDIALAVWNVDQRLASKEGAWPLVVGVHVMNGTWDLAALRFDAPEGAAYSVVHVEPRFLFQGEEVFLDTMGPDTKRTSSWNLTARQLTSTWNSTDEWTGSRLLHAFLKPFTEMRTHHERRRSSASSRMLERTSPGARSPRMDSDASWWILEPSLACAI